MYDDSGVAGGYFHLGVYFSAGDWHNNTSNVFTPNGSANVLFVDGHITPYKNLRLDQGEYTSTRYSISHFLNYAPP